MGKLINLENYRLTEVMEFHICENGHIRAVPTGRKQLEVRHDWCGQWTWADGNYCVNCGQPLNHGRKV